MPPKSLVDRDPVLTPENELYLVRSLINTHRVRENRLTGMILIVALRQMLGASFQLLPFSISYWMEQGLIFLQLATPAEKMMDPADRDSILHFARRNIVQRFLPFMLTSEEGIRALKTLPFPDYLQSISKGHCQGFIDLAGSYYTELEGSLSADARDGSLLKLLAAKEGASFCASRCWESGVRRFFSGILVEISLIIPAQMILNKVLSYPLLRLLSCVDKVKEHDLRILVSGEEVSAEEKLKVYKRTYDFYLDPLFYGVHFMFLIYMMIAFFKGAYYFLELRKGEAIPSDVAIWEITTTAFSSSKLLLIFFNLLVLFNELPKILTQWGIQRPSLADKSSFDKMSEIVDSKWRWKKGGRTVEFGNYHFLHANTAEEIKFLQVLGATCVDQGIEILAVTEQGIAIRDAEVSKENWKKVVVIMKEFSKHEKCFAQNEEKIRQQVEEIATNLPGEKKIIRLTDKDSRNYWHLQCTFLEKMDMEKYQEILKKIGFSVINSEFTLSVYVYSFLEKRAFDHLCQELTRLNSGNKQASRGAASAIPLSRCSTGNRQKATRSRESVEDGVMPKALPPKAIVLTIRFSNGQEYRSDDPRTTIYPVSAPWLADGRVYAQFECTPEVFLHCGFDNYEEAWHRFNNLVVSGHVVASTREQGIVLTRETYRSVATGAIVNAVAKLKLLGFFGDSRVYGQQVATGDNGQMLIVFDTPIFKTH